MLKQVRFSKVTKHMLKWGNCPCHCRHQTLHCHFLCSFHQIKMPSARGIHGGSGHIGGGWRAGVGDRVAAVLTLTCTANGTLLTFLPASTLAGDAASAAPAALHESIDPVRERSLACPTLPLGDLCQKVSIHAE